MEEGEKNRNEKSRKYRKTFSFFLFLSFLIFKVLLKTALWLTKDLWAQGNWIPKPKILPVTLWKETLSININLAAFLCPPPPPKKKKAKCHFRQHNFGQMFNVRFKCFACEHIKVRLMPIYLFLLCITFPNVQHRLRGNKKIPLKKG